jgi:peptide/nickel transport system substrate-binding protein
MLRRGAFVAAGATTLALVGCGDDDDDGDDDGGETPATTATAAPSDGTETAIPTEPDEGDGQGVAGLTQYGPGERVKVVEDTFFATTGQTAGGTMRYNTEYPGFTLEPNQAYQGDYVICRQVYQGLAQVTGSGGLMLYAADTIEDVDELNWTVTIRPENKFHNREPVNGRAMTAEDVKFSFERVKADQTSLFGFQHAFVDTIEAVDDLTVTFKGAFPFSSRYDLHAIMIVTPEAVDGTDLNKVGIGTGPWMLDSEYDSSAVTNFTRHPEFIVPDRPFPEKLEWQHIPDQAAHVAAFRSNQIDHIGRNLPKLIADDTKGDDGTVVRQPFFGISYLAMRGDKPEFADPRIRQALSLAVNRQQLLDTLEFGEGNVSGPIPWSLENWALPQEEVDAFYKVDSYEENLAEAKALFEAASGESLPALTMIFPSDLQRYANGAPLVLEDLKAAGFDVSLSGLALTDLVRDHLLPGDYQLMFMQTGEVEEPLSWLTAYTSRDVPGTLTFGGGVDPEVDAAVMAFLAEFEADARVEKAREAQRLIMPKYLNQVNLFVGWGYYLQKNHLKDFRPGGFTSAYWQYDYWLENA